MELGSCHKDQYLQASYNGVAFEAMEVTSEHGRRSAIGEFPFSNTTGAVDMGRKVRRYTMTARLADDDHEARSIALIAACELPGPGILIHPTRGILNVTCENLRVRNQIIDRQGITEIDLTFVEFNLWENGFGLVGSLLGLVLRPLLAASSESFAANYSPRSEPVYLQDDVIDQAEGTAERYRQEYDRQGNPDPRASADMQQVADDETLATSTAVMDDLVRLGSAAIAQKAATPVETYESFRRLANWAATSRVSDTTSGQSLAAHVRITSGGYMAQAALDREYQTVTQALAALDQVIAVLTEEARIAYDACQNALYLELQTFMADFTRQMYQLAYGSPRRQQYNFNGLVSPLVAAYAIWDDATRAREIGIGPVGPTVLAVPN